MSWLSSLFNIGTSAATGGASDVVSGVVSGIGDTAIKLRSAITGDISPDKKAELETHLADLDTQLATAQAKINEIEAASSNMFVAGWRPAAGWTCSIALFYTFLAQPFLSWCSLNWGWQSPPVIDTGALTILLTGMLGFGGIRTYEKVKDVHNAH